MADIRSYLENRKPELVEFVRQLVSMESPSVVLPAQRPLLEALASQLRTAGFAPEILPGRTSGGLLVAGCRLNPGPGDDPRKAGLELDALGEGKPLQLLVGHCDTVWPVGTLANMPLVVKNNKIKGPGVYDMKAGLAQMVFALKAIKDLNLETPLAPVVFINSDEETGSFDSEPLLRQLAARAERVFVLEPSMGPSGQLKTARKGIGEFTVRVKGRAAHAGLEPEAGASAILELSHLIQKLASFNDPSRGITVNVGIIDGGTRPNVVAAQATAVVDVRVLHREDAERVEKSILSLKPATAGVQLEIEGSVSRAPMERTPRNRRLWELARQKGAEMGLDLAETLSGGASDGNTTSLFTATLDGLGAVGGGAHAAHEFVYIDKMLERGALLASLLSSPSVA